MNLAYSVKQLLSLTNVQNVMLAIAYTIIYNLNLLLLLGGTANQSAIPITGSY